METTDRIEYADEEDRDESGESMGLNPDQTAQLRRDKPHLFPNDEFRSDSLRSSTPCFAPSDNGAPTTGRESDLHGQIVEECKRLGWIALHGAMHVRAFRNAGEPDFVILADRGITYFVEAKSKTGKLSPAQFAMKHHIEKLGHRYAVVQSFEEFTAFVSPRF